MFIMPRYRYWLKVLKRSFKDTTASVVGTRHIKDFIIFAFIWIIGVPVLRFVIQGWQYLFDKKKFEWPYEDMLYALHSLIVLIVIVVGIALSDLIVFILRYRERRSLFNKLHEIQKKIQPSLAGMMIHNTPHALNYFYPEILNLLHVHAKVVPLEIRRTFKAVSDQPDNPGVAMQRYQLFEALIRRLSQDLRHE